VSHGLDRRVSEGVMYHDMLDVCIPYQITRMAEVIQQICLILIHMSQIARVRRLGYSGSVD
jgi:hypothetical protein